MRESDDNKPGWLFWVASALLLLWGLAGASIYVAYFIETPEEFASAAEDAAHAQAYATYVADIPAWSIGAGLIAALSRLFGAVGLLLRRAWALPMYVISLALFGVALFRAFVLANVASVMSPPHIAVEIVFLALSVFAVWFAFRHKLTGALK